MEINLSALPRRTWCISRRGVLEFDQSPGSALWSGGLSGLRSLDPPAARVLWVPSQPRAVAPHLARARSKRTDAMPQYRDHSSLYVCPRVTDVWAPNLRLRTDP